jgi:hypothetical protein
MGGDRVNARVLTLLGIAAAALGLWIYSRSPSGSSALGGVVDKVASTIRGIRNNNPTNMKDFGIQWDGMTGVDPDGFLIFGTMADGLRAPAKNLRNYGRLDGVSTVDGVARRWSKTDQDAYSANLAAWLGVDPHDSIDLEDYATLAALVRGIIRQEDGGAAELLVDSQIDSAVYSI